MIHFLLWKINLSFLRPPSINYYYVKQQFSKHLIPFYLAVILLFISRSLFAQNEEPYEKGRLRVKFTEEQVNSLERMGMRKSSSGYAKIGVSSIDKLNTQFKATSMRRVFPYAGKYEAKHRKHGLHLWYELAIDSKADVQRVRQAYHLTKEITVAEPVYQTELSVDRSSLKVVDLKEKRASIGSALNSPPNDPLFTSQWHYNNTGQNGGKPSADIGLLAAWKYTSGKSSVIVAMTDGGIDINHEDLKASLWVNEDEIPGNRIDDDNNGYVDDINGYSFVDNTGKISPHYHGIHVAGTMAAVNNNATGVSGIAGGSGNGDGIRVMSCAVYKETGGNGGFEKTYIYAADNGAVISQNSWGYTRPGFYNQSVLDAIDYFIAEAGYDENGMPVGPMQGGIVIFAAGNSQKDENLYPGCYPKVIAVAGTDYQDNPYLGSTRGTWVDLAAPAVNVISSLSKNTYGKLTGTSMACPHVSGVAALIVSKYAGNITPVEIKSRLIERADKLPTLPSNFGAGRLNAFMALQDNDFKGPETISDLTIAKQFETNFTLEWTAPGDSLNLKASVYDIRYSTSSINEANFDSASRLSNLPPPLPAGQKQTFMVEEFKINTTYYFAIRSSDYFGNKSFISNIAVGTTDNSPWIDVHPDSLNVLIQAVTAPIDIRTLTIENKGDLPLDFSGYAILVTDEKSSVKSLNGNSNSLAYQENRNLSDELNTVEAPRIKSSDDVFQRLTLANPIDSIVYDKDESPDSYTGYGASTFAVAAKFVVDKLSFLLTHVRNFYKIQGQTKAVIDIEVYKGGNEPNKGKLVSAQSYSNSSSEGEYFTYGLETPQQFVKNDIFWIVFKFPKGLILPQGMDKEENRPEGTFFYSLSKGSSWNPYPQKNTFKIRAISAPYSTTWATLSPASGTIAPHSSLTVTSQINGAQQNNGEYKLNYAFFTNDIVNRLVKVPVHLTITGQQPNIILSHKFLNLANVFVGAYTDFTFDIFNRGKAPLDISSLSSSHAEIKILNPVPMIIHPGEKAVVSLRFSPVSPGNKNGRIKIISNDPDQPILQIIVAGVGVVPPVIVVLPDTVHAMGRTGTIISDSITIKNTGDFPLTFSFPEFDANNPGVKGVGSDKKFGYKWIDSDQEGGPKFNWVDIAGMDNMVHPPNSGSEFLSWANPFDFYGDNYDLIYVAANGFLHLGSTLGEGNYNTPLPDAGVPNNIIAPFWCNLDVNDASIYFIPYLDKTIVQYTNALCLFDSSRVTFQVILYNNGDIEFHYKKVPYTTQWATIGIENKDGTDGIQISYTGPYAKDSLAIRFIAPTPKFITGVSQLSGILMPDEEATIGVTIDATSLKNETYKDQLVILSNDPIHSPTSVPFILTLSNTLRSEESTSLSDSVSSEIKSKASTLSAENQNKSADQLMLHPNPVESSTNISYELKQADHVRVEILDNNGAKIATLIDGNKPAGKYRVNFDPKGLLAYGVYLCRVQIGNDVKTKRMIIK